ncbi:MAG: T9SS type A sorting domain-containing protein, partial [Ignavibacteriales bacterium]|nr:T9SS type A sorting domain-containing protein [Ignavibacteriales bacterium]
VEKFIDSCWMPIAALPGNGTSSAAHTYNYIDKHIKTGKMVYRLRQTDYDGAIHYSSSIDVLVTQLVTAFELMQNYPNPFNPSTKITYALPAESKVVIEIYLVTGEKAVTLVDATMPPGYHSLDFDARNFNAGIYLLRLKAQSVNQSFVKTQKMLFVK